ncbi:MAG: sensor histidine kinase [Armatimonadota bacterium]
MMGDHTPQTGNDAAFLAGQVREFRQRLERAGVAVDVAPDAQAAELFSRLQQAILDELARCRESEARLELVIANSPDIIFDQDCDLRYTWIFNPAAPLVPADVIGKTDEELLPPAQAERLTRVKRRILETGESVHDEFELSPGGITRYYDVLYTPRYNDQRQITGVLSYTREITDRKHAEQERERLLVEVRQRSAELQRLNDTLEQRVHERTAALETANKELQAFEYSVSHDLRAPLRRIDSLGAILQREYADRFDAEGQELLSLIHGSVLRMSGLIDDMLRLSRIGRAEMHVMTVDLSALATEIMEELRRRDPERQAEVIITPGLRAQGDRDLLRIALENLLGNAWKFTGKRPVARIEFGMTQQDRETVYCIRDNGAGFDMQYVGQLFAPFTRLHTDEEFPGTGIGLSIVRRIIQRHGGRIWAEGYPDQGATFCFTLPLQEPVRQEPANE